MALQLLHDLPLSFRILESERALADAFCDAQLFGNRLDVTAHNFAPPKAAYLILGRLGWLSVPKIQSPGRTAGRLSNTIPADRVLSIHRWGTSF